MSERVWIPESVLNVVSEQVSAAAALQCSGSVPRVFCLHFEPLGSGQWRTAGGADF